MSIQLILKNSKESILCKEDEVLFFVMERLHEKLSLLMEIEILNSKTFEKEFLNEFNDYVNIYARLKEQNVSTYFIEEFADMFHAYSSKKGEIHQETLDEIYSLITGIDN